MHVQHIVYLLHLTIETSISNLIQPGKTNYKINKHLGLNNRVLITLICTLYRNSVITPRSESIFLLVSEKYYLAFDNKIFYEDLLHQRLPCIIFSIVGPLSGPPPGNTQWFSKVFRKLLRITILSYFEVRIVGTTP